MQDVIIWMMDTTELSPLEKLLLSAKLYDYNLGNYIDNTTRNNIIQIISGDTDLSEIFKKIKKTPSIRKIHGIPTKFVMNLWKFD